MKNAEAIQTLKLMQAQVEWEYPMDYAAAIDEAIKALEAQEWVPCKERLPETEEQVLIYAWNVHYVLAKYKEIRTCDGVYKMAWVAEDAYSIPQEIKHEVICWRHLPEPWKGDARE